MKASTARTHQARGPVATRKCAARQILTRAKKEKKKSEDTSNHEEVYIGQGKYVTDDPKKYPSKSQWTGGWAGGEEGLQKFLEEAAVRTALLFSMRPAMLQPLDGYLQPITAIAQASAVSQLKKHVSRSTEHCRDSSCHSCSKRGTTTPKTRTPPDHRRSCSRAMM